MSVETEVTVISSLPKHHRFPFVSLCDGEPWLLPPQRPEPETAVLLTGFTRPGGRDKSEAEVPELSAARGEGAGALPILPLTPPLGIGPRDWEREFVARGNSAQLGSVGGLGSLTKASHICRFRW